MALGARRGAVLWMVMKEAFGLLAIGLALGMAAAYTLSRSVESQLFGMAPRDLGVVGIAAAVLATVAGVAGFLPARRASLIDPIPALRHE